MASSAGKAKTSIKLHVTSWQNPHLVAHYCNYCLPKLVPNPFFGKYSLDFGESRLKFMARGMDDYLRVGIGARHG